VADQRDSKKRVYGILGVNMPCHILLDDFAKTSNYYLENFDLLVLPGGVKALEKLRLEESVIKFIKEWNKQGKLISSTCHGAQLLISGDAVRGRKISGYYSLEIDIKNAGALYTAEPCVVDGNIISSPHYDHMGIWMETTIAKLEKHYCELSTVQNSRLSPFPPGLEDDVKNLAIDFDGVLHNDSKGYFDGTCYGAPLFGSLDSIVQLSKHYKLMVFTAKAKSTRPLVNGKSGTQLVWEWLDKYGFKPYIETVTAEKPRAFAYIDDRAIRFSSWKQVMEDLDSIKEGG
jgi:protease I